MILKTDYKDDIIDSSENQYRKYEMIENSDGTVSFVDETTYLQEGDQWVADDVNATNDNINRLHELISYVEESNVATQAYEADDFVQFVDEDENIQLCYVTTDIAIGDTFTEGANIRIVTIMDILRDINIVTSMTESDIDSIWESVFGG